MNKFHNLLLYSWQIAIAGIIVAVGTTVVFWNQLPPLVPLFYSRPWGVDQLVTKHFVFLIPILILIIQISNQIIFSLNANENLLQKLSNIVSVVSTVMLTLGLLRIILLIS